jgi:hypothetical protein
VYRVEEEILHGRPMTSVIYISRNSRKIGLEIRYICITTPRMNRSRKIKVNPTTKKQARVGVQTQTVHASTRTMRKKKRACESGG